MLRDHDLCAALVDVAMMALLSKALSAINPPSNPSIASDADRIETVAGQQDERTRCQRVGRASILVVMPPLERPIAWLCVPLLRPDRGDGL